MPRHFEVPNAPADVWMPLDTTVPAPGRFAYVLRVLARPREPRAAATVQRDLDAVAAQLAEERPAQNEGWRVAVLPLFDTIVSPELRLSLWLTAGAVLLVLLMATTSVAGLLLARATTRERELRSASRSGPLAATSCGCCYSNASSSRSSPGLSG